MKIKVLLAVFLCIGCKIFAQTVPRWDTLKYQKFQSNLIVGVFQSYRNFENSFEQFDMPDSTGISRNNYKAESRLVTGIDVTYDKFSFALGLRSVPPAASTGKGNTQTLNANLNFGGNVWYVQNSLRYFKGFYDNNTGAYDTTIRQTGKYYQRPDLENIVLKTKFLYFTNNRKFSFRSGYASNYRQLRSAATWILSANLNLNVLSADSSLINYASRPYYGDYSSLKGFSSLGLSLNFGGAATLVIMKGFFINAMFILGPEQQWRAYTYGDGVRNLSYVSLSGDVRFSIGLNLKRCYLISFSSNDFTLYNSSFVGITNYSLAGGFAFGWRFKSKTPKFYKEVQKTRLYKIF